LDRTNLQGNYQLVEITPEEDFNTKVRKVRQMALDGFNITVPYKEKIMDHLDEIDGYARNVGAVNTVLCKNNRWIGYNTDGIGYVRSLVSKFPSLQTNKDIRILLLGAGGATKGIYHALLLNGFRDITIANRTTDNARRIVGNDNEVLTLEAAQKQIAEFDLFIQTTSVGMKPNDKEAILSLDGIKQSAIVSDIVYQPLFTTFLKEAKAKGASIHFGHTMLLYQAQYAFEIWTKSQPNMTGLDNSLLKILEGNSIE
jgi:shikimate dehydrogenase